MSIIQYGISLQEGDTIGVTATSDTANLDTIDVAEERLRKLGYHIVETDNVRKSKGIVSSDASTRAKEWMQLWQDPNVSMMIAARGGDLLLDMLPFLHTYQNQIRMTKPVKWMQGYSDTSLLNFYLTTNYNIATIHAENIGGFAGEIWEDAQLNNLKIVTGAYSNHTMVQNSFLQYENSFGTLEEDDNVNTENVMYQMLGADSNYVCVEGRMIGGCIDVLSHVVGTKYDHTRSFCQQFLEGMIWYFDIYELSSTELYARLFQMKEAGWFENVNCFLFGRRFYHQVTGDFTYEKAIYQVLSELQVPIICDVDIGHVAPQLTIVNGSMATFIYQEQKGQLIQKFC